MDIVYASLTRRPGAGSPAPGETAEVIGALWAHATPDDGLEHAYGQAEPDRMDLLLYLLSGTPDAPRQRSALHRAATLLSNCHLASPALRRRYLAPQPPPALPSDKSPAA